MTGAAGPKRFIAGAVCPRCGAMDRIRVFAIDGSTLRDCVACGFSDLLEEAATDSLPKGRLDAPRPLTDGRSKPLKFHPPPMRKPKSAPDDEEGR